MRKPTIREELIVSMALRAGEMDALHYIDLDTTVVGEEALSIFIVNCVDAWINEDFDPYEFDEDGCDCFDIWIEEKLKQFDETN